MADVKWIKVTTDIFEDEKILLIESLPNADMILVIWFKLLCLAGKMNNSGVFKLNDKIAFTPKMFSTIFRKSEDDIKTAFEIFEAYGMVEIVKDVVTIPNWGKHQDLEKFESKKEYMRNYMTEYREKQKNIASKTNSKVNSKTNSKVNSKTNVNPQDIDNINNIDIYTDIDSDTETNKDSKISYQLIVDMYNNTCVSLPKVEKLSKDRRDAIKARSKIFTIDDFKKLFEKAEASNWLKGQNSNNWIATFDWLITDKHMAKVIEGFYDNRISKSKRAQELDDLTDMSFAWAERGDDPQ